MRVNTGDRDQVEISGQPNICPYCHKAITPNLIWGYQRNDELDVFMCCPDSNCGLSFVGFYSFDRSYDCWIYSNETTKGNIFNRNFNNTIDKISPSFVLIYNQSYFAEQNGLSEVCGVGYRKALEFLIKEYLILNNPDHKEKIEKKMLGNCIEEYVSDSRIKMVAKRAVWLGNDETHFVRKWEHKSLEDLKKLIDLTIHWIEMEDLTKSLTDDMPG